MEAPALATSSTASGALAEGDLERAIPARAMYPFGWSRRELKRALWIAVAASIALYFLWQVQAILPPFLLSFFLAAMLDPTLSAMERQGRPRWLGIVLIYLLALLSLVLIGVLVVPSLTRQVEGLSQNFNAYYETVVTRIDAFLLKHQDQLRRFGFEHTTVNSILAAQGGRESWIQRTTGGLIGGISRFLQDAASKLFWLVIIPIASFFFMRDYPVLRARIIALWPEQYHHRIAEMSNGVVEVFARYINGLARICALYGLTMCVFYWVAGLRYGLFLGLLAGVLYAMPYLGQLLTACIVGAIAYSMDAHAAFFFVTFPANSLAYTLLIILGTLMMNNVFDQVVFPKVVGGSVGLHPILSIFAMAAGASLFGIWGMLLAVPVAGSLKIILCYFFPKLNQPPPPHLLERTASS